MPRRSFGEFSCSVARAVDVVGDSWTPLILRDVFLGVDQFDDLVRDLGISRALLTTRLGHLTDAGILEAELYQERPARHCYRLTAAGSELVPILVALMLWGDRWRSPEGPPLRLEHECGHLLGARLRCEGCDGEVTAASVSPRPGPGGRLAVGTAVVAERLVRAQAAREQAAHDQPAQDQTTDPERR